MNRKLILVLAMAMLLVGGAFVNGHAQNVNGPYFTKPACWSFACGIATPHAAVKGLMPLETPAQMGAVGY
ncbi:MAG: hypothetical protein P4L55_02650 [Syntrophobacteraceae bacterium]|nr:hypothetical protein [Syntrophobacteraceae bacterium]